MFKNMKVGTKISLGFASLLILSAIIGVVSVTSMKSASQTAHILVEETMPQNSLCDRMTDAMSDARLSLRGFQYTGNKKAFDKAMDSIAEVEKIIQETESFVAEHPNLTQLKEMIGQIKTQTEAYKVAARNTAEKFAEMTQIQASMTKSRESFLKITTEYLAEQNEKMTADIKAKADEAVLLHRVEKANSINACVDLLNVSMVYAMEAISKQDATILNASIKTKEQLTKRIEDLRAITTKEVDLKRLDGMKLNGTAYNDGMMDLQKAMQEMEEVAKRRSQTGEKALGAINEAMTASITSTKNGATISYEALNRSSTLVITGLIVAMLVGVALAFFITRGITSALNRIIHGLNSSSDQVAAASGQVASASQSLAEGASESASSLEETSASLEEMSSMTKQNADNARQASAMANAASESAEQGRAATQRMGAEINTKITNMSEAIQQIKKSTSQTAKIIKTIDEIAFQTNLLALNAAVEAARAGEAGKGFAVVAEEVRNLAMRSAEAAKNTSALIEESQKNADRGVVVSTEVAEILKRAVEIEIAKGFQTTAEAASKVKALISEVAAASEEQAKGIEQVNAAVSQMDKVTQGNAANAEESASASEELSAQAREMSEMVRDLALMVSDLKDAKQQAPAPTPVKRSTPVISVPARKKVDASHAEPTGTNRIKKTLKDVTPSQVIPLTEAELAEF